MSTLDFHLHFLALILMPRLIKCLTQLFSLFGLCSCIHSDRGSAFMSKKFITFVQSKSIVGCSCITSVVMVNVKSTMT